jgi:hypothetical protein
MKGEFDYENDDVGFIGNSNYAKNCKKLQYQFL